MIAGAMAVGCAGLRGREHSATTSVLTMTFHGRSLRTASTLLSSGPQISVVLMF